MRVSHALLVATGMAYAAVSAAADPGAAAGPKAKDPRLVCFAEKTTGSHLRKRICVTPEELERRRQADQEAIRKLRQSSGARGQATKDPSL